MSNVWDNHYQKQKSILHHPDENLVRILSRITPPNLSVLDFGSGSGRHIPLLKEKGFDVSASDSSIEAVERLKVNFSGHPCYLTDKLPYSFQKGQFGLIVSWGVFHYNERSVAKAMLVELHQALAPNGYLAGSIRAASDTHLKLNDGKMNLVDLNGGYAETYTLVEVNDLLRPFSNVEIGYTERTPLGKLDERICHWFFLAKK